MTPLALGAMHNSFIDGHLVPPVPCDRPLCASLLPESITRRMSRLSRGCTSIDRWIDGSHLDSWTRTSTKESHRYLISLRITRSLSGAGGVKVAGAHSGDGIGAYKRFRRTRSLHSRRCNACNEGVSRKEPEVGNLPAPLRARGFPN